MRKVENMIDELILSIDKHINPTSCTKALRLGAIIGFLVFLSLLGCELAELISMPKDKFIYIFLLAPFPLGIAFLRINSFAWQKMRRLELSIKNIDMKNCGCELDRLPAYREFGWIKARITEYYTCIFFGFITGFIFGWCLAVLVGLLFLYLFGAVLDQF